ncbi:SRPBCC family protein [Pontivivens ytuae]|uniref:SRPBCC family protein n=1 Tax=Pontivivens ytuae TaxID=2789856 RepID=A0A7S9LPF8_9RHOB|nr:SRPBCC family protein [Pontivivens ytuae]QPH52839.1 SRPBCC family protein [Pontivivens ytuae]
MRVELTCHIDAPPDEVWRLLQRSALLEHIAAPLVVFRPIDGPFPEHWSPGRYRAWMLLVGVLPMGRQWIDISFPDEFTLRDNGAGDLVRRWDHWIFVEAEGNGTRYTDRVDVEAGLLTPFIWFFARVFYAHRQRRWRALAADGFRAFAT